MLDSMTYSRICDLNKDEKPREKLMRLGAENLSDVELLALIIGTGGKDKSALDLAREILKSTDGLNYLKQYDIQQLLSHKYINVAKATVIKATLELSVRLNKPRPQRLTKITKPDEVYQSVKSHFEGQTKECLILISIDSRNKLISKDIISVGSLNETIVSPREIFSTALNKNAACIIIAHNHPSNDPTPSQEDIVVTERIAKLGKEMNIPLLDHIIVTENEFISMKQLNIFTTFEKKAKGGE
jgi:DNA repair protein RadC